MILTSSTEIGRSFAVPLKNSLQDWQKIESIRYRNYKKNTESARSIMSVDKKAWCGIWWRKSQQTQKLTHNLFQIKFFGFLHFQKVKYLLV